MNALQEMIGYDDDCSQDCGFFYGKSRAITVCSHRRLNNIVLLTFFAKSNHENGWTDCPTFDRKFLKLIMAF
jgi:hypothetical protein